MDTEAKLKQIADSYSRDVEDVRTVFEQEKDDLTLTFPDKDEAAVEQQALRTTQGEITKRDSTPGDSDFVELFTVGYGGTQTWKTGTFAIALAVAQPPDEPRFLASLLFDTDHVDSEEVAEVFGEPFQAVKASMEWRTVDEVPEAYRLESNRGTELLDWDVDESREEIKALIDDDYLNGEIVLTEITDAIGRVGDTFSESVLGLGLQKLSGTIVDAYIPDDGRGRYVVQDDSFVDHRDLDDELVRGPYDSPGLTCWADSAVMQYGEKSYCDFYGTVSVNSNQDSESAGQASMNVFAVDPVFGTEPEVYTSNESSNDAVEEELI